MDVDYWKGGASGTGTLKYIQAKPPDCVPGLVCDKKDFEGLLSSPT